MKTCVLGVNVAPNASRNEVAGWETGKLKIRIKSPPTEGKANKELISYLARILGVSKTSVSIIKGAKSRQKTIAFTGLEHSDMLSKIELQHGQGGKEGEKREIKEKQASRIHRTG